MNKHSCTSSFSAGQTEELFFALKPEPDTDFISEAKALMEKYSRLIEEQKSSIENEVMLRFHLSDVATQVPVLQNILGERCSFVSFIGQPPAGNSRLSLGAYHIKQDTILDKKISNNSGAFELDVKLNNYGLLYHCQRKLKAGNSFAQANEELACLKSALEVRGGTMKDNCLRTWFYVRDIDNNYAGVVKARRELFDKIGMTDETHYLASTGIEGQWADPHRIIGLDSLCTFGVSQDQIEFIHALDHMSPTHHYGVTFERGTRVIYGDRSHYCISGTASIDAAGEIMHIGNIRKQTQRTIENIRALLENHGASLSDMKIAIVYLRDSTDAETVEAELNTLLPAGIPRIIVKASVCRPGWLIEIDGVAINDNGNSDFKVFS